MGFSLATAALFTLLLASRAGAVTAPVYRGDVASAFGSAACAGTASGLPGSLWGGGVYDAQIEGRSIERQGELAVPKRRLEHSARALAALRGSGGYSYGWCERKDAATPGASKAQGKDRAWVVALPSPSPLGLGKNGEVTLPTLALNERCTSYRSDFSPREGGMSREVHPAAGVVATAGLGDGVLSVSCQPKTPRWRGPVLWFLYPVKQGPAPTAPRADILAAVTSTASAPAMLALGAWINTVRGSEGRKPLVFTAALNEQASLLSVDGGLSHDRMLLRKVSSTLANSQVRLLGENRVRAANLKAMGWLWWNSPRHRELLLNQTATSAGIGMRQVGNETLAVLIIGAEQPLTTAKAAAPAPPVKSR